MILGETRFRDQVGQHCRSPKCDALVVWCDVSGGNKQMMVNAEPLSYTPGADFGNVRLVDVGGALRPLAIVLKPRDLFGRQGTLHHSHFVTCPDAARFRKRGYER
jgi:hypothetical protein